MSLFKWFKKPEPDGMPNSAVTDGCLISKPAPSESAALKDRGNAYLQKNELKEAADCYRRAIELNPSYAEAFNNLGYVFWLQGNPDEAIAHYRKALEFNPDLVQAHQNLGFALLDLGQTDGAETILRKVVELDPEHAEALQSLGVIAAQRGDFVQAETLLRRAIKLQPDYFEAYCHLGVSLHMSGRQDESEVCYRRAIDINPDYAEAHSNLGIVLMELGKMNEAEKALSRALELSPGKITPLLGLLSLLPYQQNDPRFSQIETIYAQRGSLPLQDQIKLSFAIGKAMEDIGQYDKSFSAYEEGNRLHYQYYPFDETEDDLLLKDLCSIFTTDLFNKYAALAAILPAVKDERVPVFIVGMPRSGTTLIEQTLASHPAIYGAGEINMLSGIAKKFKQLCLETTNAEDALLALRKLGQEYLENVWKFAPEGCYITDKMPGNFRYLGLIHLMLPNAKIIHSMRDPMDTCFSCYAQPFSVGHEYCFDLRALGRQYLRYSKLMEHWRNVLPSESMLDVHYENMVANHEQETWRMLDYLGLPWDQACLRFYESKRIVRTASVSQVRKPLYTSSVTRWKHFEKHLAPLLEIVQSKI